MRLLPAILLVAAAISAAEKQPPACPLWDGRETIEQYARRAKLPPTHTLDLGNGVKLELVLVPAGEFMMGDGNFADEKPAHRVRIAKPFYLGKFEATQAQYQQMMGVNPSQFKGQDLPVEQVSWDDAQEFCSKVSEKTKWVVRLPTEAGWEYACRAGTKTDFYTGGFGAEAERAAWYKKNSGNTTHAVGQKLRNAWGLYDMHGNVWEWCADWYAEYEAVPFTGPQPVQGQQRVLRSGSWCSGLGDCRSSRRRKSDPGCREAHFGFRVAVDVPSKTP